MSEKDLGEELEKFEEGIENLKNSEFKVFGIRVTPLTLGAAFTALSTAIGGLYGAFTVYNDYMDMKEQIESYEAPDLSGFQEQISVLEEKMRGLEDSVLEARDYTRDIKIDLKSDIDRIEDIVDKTEARTKNVQDETSAALRETEKDVRSMIDNAEERFDNKRDALDLDTERKMKELEDRLNTTIQRVLDNPLSN